MSYIIAHILFSEMSSEYPVECYRTDVKPGDAVLVLLHDGRIAEAMVSSVSYLHWECKSQILCKSSEGKIIDGRLQMSPETPQKVGLVSLECLISELRYRGWTPLWYRNTYRAILAKCNETQTARISVRKNGIDLQLLPDRQQIPRAFSKLPTGAFNEGRTVRHNLSHTTFNLFEGIVRFAEAFESNSGEYDRFFIPVGQVDRRSEMLKKMSEERQRTKYVDDYATGMEDWDSGMFIWYDEMMGRD